MRLTFLGTAAAEGYPGIFCNCDNCNEARALGGRNLRKRSALLVNDDLLIDFGPDLLASAQHFNLNLSKVTTALVTHAHEDHFYLGNFTMRQADFTARLDIPTLRLFAPQDAIVTLEQAFTSLDALRVQTTPIQAFDRWKHGCYTFNAYRAYHAIDVFDALFYSVSDGQHAILYATDTGPFPAETRDALRGQSFDVIILEETLGKGQWSQHLGFEDFLTTANWLRAEAILRPGGRLIAHHFSHSGNPTHEKLEAILGPHDVEVAYDGLEIRLGA